MDFPGIPLLFCAAAAVLHAQPESSLKICRNPPSQYQLEWFALKLRPYQIEGSPDLAYWTDIGPSMTGNAAIISLLVPETAPQFFYRLREGAMRPGFDEVAMSKRDDHSYPEPDGPPEEVPLGFSINYFGNIHTGCYVNNNGNITFDQALTQFTPELFGFLGAEMIAPFWADVDTRAVASGVTRFSNGTDTVDGHLAFGVTYRNVGYFDSRAEKLNSFQVILIDRSDISPGDFDMEFNYNHILWETGSASSSGGVNGYGGNSARVGFASGDGLFAEVSGSGETLTLLDANPSTGVPNFETGLIYRSLNSTIPGRLIFPVRGGVPQGSFMVNAGPDQLLAADHPASFQLSGEAPEGIPGLTFVWTQTGGPASAEISDEHTLNPTVTISEPGLYEFQLAATKAGTLSVTTADTVQVEHPGIFTVEAGGPYLLAAEDPLTVTLNQAEAAFSPGVGVSVLWSQSGGDDAIIVDPSAVQPTVILPGPGLYFFEMVATTNQNPPFTRFSSTSIEHD